MDEAESMSGRGLGGAINVCDLPFLELDAVSLFSRRSWLLGQPGKVKLLRRLGLFGMLKVRRFLEPSFWEPDEARRRWPAKLSRND